MWSASFTASVGEENLADKVRVVINRQGADTVEEGISVKKAEEVIGKPIFWQVPNDPKAVIGARVAGQPLIKHARRAGCSRASTGLPRHSTAKPVSRRRSTRKQGRMGILRQALAPKF